MTIHLFYGPGARAEACLHSLPVGGFVSPPIGEEGLKVDDAREAVQILSATSVGDQKGAVLIGPLDSATAQSCDALLKTLEEYREGSILPILWAWDVAEVPLTVRSRCILKWSPGEAERLPDEVWELAFVICEAVLRGDLHVIIKQVQAGKTEIQDLSRGITQCILANVREGRLEYLKIWTSLREALTKPTLTPIGLTHSLLRATLIQ